jgi:glycosyltransferase involved in cell wall biosynthesis
VKISLLSWDLSNNSLGRGYVLAKVLQRKYQVEIVGPMFGKTIWTPVNTGEFRYRPVPGVSCPAFFDSIRRMLKLITGDVVYALKLRPSSYGIALMKMLCASLPVVLDIDDWELGFYRTNALSGKPSGPMRPPLSPRDPNFYLYMWMIEKLRFLASDVTVASKFLQRKFGGIIVPHGRDTNAFDPRRYDRASLRKQWGLNGKKVVMFLGTPLAHKGLGELLEALKSMNPDVILVVVGAQEDNYTRRLKASGKDRIRMIGMQPFDKAPEFLSMADLVVLPQRRGPSTEGQIPAKLFDAMAMGKPIIATRVSDMPEILDGCGLVVDPGDVHALSDAVQYLLEKEDEARKLGSIAREKCIRDYSWDKIEKILSGVFEKYR